jgi:hypothetical protein
VVALAIVSGAATAWRALKEPAGRVRTVGLLLFLTACMGLATAIGWGRASGDPEAGSVPRYVTLATPLACWLYAVAQVQVGTLRKLLSMSVFTVICAVFLLNMEEGLHGGRGFRGRLAAFERDVLAGKSSLVLADQYTQEPFCICESRKRLAERLHMLRQANVADFGKLSEADSWYEGSHDSVDCSSIDGWAWAKNLPTTPISVDVYADGHFICTARADRFRPDLLNNGKGDGKHGFSVQLPLSLRDGNPHSISVRIAGLDLELNDTPKAVLCSP